MLAGAPSAVAAINRRAVATLVPGKDRCSVTCKGFEAAPVLFESLGSAPRLPATALLCALHDIKAVSPSCPFELNVDTCAFVSAAGKYGIGSSAAALVAIYGAFCTQDQRTPTIETAIEAHRLFQGGGSGVDVAAAISGGVLRFEAGNAQPVNLGTGLEWQFIYSGHAASTQELVARFQQWQQRQKGRLVALNTLADNSAKLFDAPNELDAWLSYAEALQQLDRDANIGIYTDTHRALADAAEALGMVYKPCGAGGGDIGMVIAEHREQLKGLSGTIALTGASPLELEVEPSGLEIQ